MASRLAVVPRIALVLAACVLATVTATVSFAAPSRGVLVVPDVRHQAYVFAKGTLEDAGFAWRVRGPVKGYAANMVVAQTPAPGTRVVDTGAPTISLTLERNKHYAEKGTPENAAPYAGTALRLVARAAAKPAAKPKPKHAAAPKRKRAAKPKPARRRHASRVPGAPREPFGEVRLDARARALDTWLANHRTPTLPNQRHWLYQHAWIVTGARFGWSHGEQALRILIAVDRKIEARWGIGARSRAIAERALAEVRGRRR